MPEPRRVRRRRAGLPPCRAPLSALALALAVGCASTTSSNRVDRPAPDPLATVIARQERSPDRRAMNAPPPPGVPPELASPLTGAELERANLSLESVLSQVPGAPAEASPQDRSRATGDGRLEAMQAYVLGRTRRLDGDLGNALEDLRHAAKLDPGSPSVWRELGEAESASGNRTGAASAFRRAAELDPSDIRSLEMLSRGALDRRDFDEALRVLAVLRGLDSLSYDPALPSILGVRLGRALLERGYLRAGSDALRASLVLPDRFAGTTNYTAELTQLYRQRGDLWRDLADAALKRGDAARAASDYEAASALPGLNPGAILPRRVFALMRLGRSGQATELLIEQSRLQRGRIDDRALALIRYLASSSEAGPPLSSALARVQSELSPEDRALAGSALARARAAALPGEPGLVVLRDHLRGAPMDEAVVRDLLSRLPAEPPGPILNEVIRLISAAPALEPRYTGTLLNGPVTPLRLLEGWSSASEQLASSDAGRVLHGRLLAATGEYERAQDELSAITDDSPAAQAAVVARTEILLKLGRFDEAHAVLAKLDEGSSDDARAAKAVCLARMNEPEAALAMLEPLLHQESGSMQARVERLLLAARLQLSLRRYDEARRLLDEVNERDPARDEAYAGLIRIYSPQQPADAAPSPLASEAKLIETVRALMAANPSSPTLRWLRAREALGRGQLDVAERDLLDLAEDYPDRDSVVTSLVEVWRASRSLEKAESWLRDRSSRRPWEAVYELELARVLGEQRRNDEAIALLERRLRLAPGDEDVSRRLEQILRDAGRPERAAELTEARLARTPQSAEAMVELAELSLGRGDAQKAKATLEALFNQKRPLDAATLDRLGRLCLDAARAVAAGKTPLPAPYLELVLFVTTQRPEVPLMAHLSALQALARTQGSVDTIIDIADRATAQYPQMGSVVFTSAVSELLGRGGGAQARRAARPGDALKVIEHACTRLKPPPATLLALWLRVAGQNDGADPAALIRIMEIARDTDAIDALLQEFIKNAQPEDPASAAAEVAYALASNAAALNREDLSLWLLRVALRHNPNHLMSNNDLGYRLLLQDETVEEAAVLVERAYRAMVKDPGARERSSITDSMGWARYRTGIIDDEPGENGGPLLEGAVSLLTRAASLADADLAAAIKQQGDPNLAAPPGYIDVGAIIRDHLGDALWRAGQNDRAIEEWTSAAERAESSLKAARDFDRGVSDATLRELSETATNARAKAQAAREHGAPQVARTVRPVNTPGIAEPPGASDTIQ